MLEQWLIEGNLSQKEALMLSCDMLAAGIDTVNPGYYNSKKLEGKVHVKLKFTFEHNDQ